MTAAELERELVRVLVPGEASFEVMQELVNRARAVELLEPLLVPIGTAINRSKSEWTRDALEQVARLIREASPLRREIVRQFEGEEVPAG